MQEIQHAVQDVVALDGSSDERVVRCLLEHLPYAALVIHLPARFIAWCNDATETVLGYTKEDITGKSTRVLHIDDAEYDAFARAYQPVVLGDEVFRGSHWMKHADGFHLPVDFVITPIRKTEEQLSVVGFINSLFGESDPQIRAGLTKLTAREREVFDLTRQGYSAKKVANRLGISQRTAEAHRAALLEKLGYPSTLELLGALLEAKASLNP